MTNAERLLLLKRARSELQRVRDELDLATAVCPDCSKPVGLDASAKRLDDDLGVFASVLESWIRHVSLRPPRSERVSPDA